MKLIFIFSCFSQEVKGPLFVWWVFSWFFFAFYSWQQRIFTTSLTARIQACFRAGAKWRAKKKNYKPSVPAIIVGNLRFLDSKMDELGELIKTRREYHECSLMCFTETWLHAHFPDHSVTMFGSRTCMLDKVVCLSINEKYGQIALLWMKSGIIPDNVAA